MKIEERLHDAMHEYADAIEPEPGSWSRIAARFDEEPVPRRPARGGLVFAGVALALVVALVAVLAVREDSGPGTRVSTGPAGGMPSRILAVNADGHATILDSATGDQQGGIYEVPTVAEGTQIAVTPDGQDAYVVQGNGKEGCADYSILRLPVGAGARGGDQIATDATEPTVSPDGRYLAYLHCLPGDNANEIVLRDLTSGQERVTKAPAGMSFGYHLEFAADSNHILVALLDYKVVYAPMLEIDIVSGESAPGRELGIAASGQGWVGVRGTTGEYLGVKGTPPNVLHLTEVSRSPQGSSLFSAGDLFTVPSVPAQVVSDRSGRHILAVVDHSLYRWSEGEASATKVADGVIDAAWIPDPPAAVPAGKSVAVLGGNRVVLVDGKSGSVARELFFHEGITSVTPAVDGKSVYAITNEPGPCRGGPETFRVPLDGGTAHKVLTGVTSVREVAASGGPLLAYTGSMDCSDAGQVIRFGTLSDPGRGLRNPTEVRFPADTTELGILDASPDGRALLVRVVRPSGAALSIIDVPSGSVTTVPGTGSVTVAAFSRDTANAFLQVMREQDGKTRIDLIDRAGHIVSAFSVPAGGLAIGTEPLRLLGTTDDGRAYEQTGNNLAYFHLPGRVTAAALMPGSTPAPPPPASKNAPNALLAAVGGNRLVFLASSNGSEQTSYATIPGISSVSVTPDGKEILFAYNAPNSACPSGPGPEVDRFSLKTNTATPIVGGSITPVVSPDGRFVAYGITCDGHTLGLTNLVTGANYRTDPLAGTKSDTSANIESVEVLGWSPDSKRLLYRLTLKGDSSPHYYVGRLWPMVRQSETKVVELASGSNVSTAAFVDDHTVAMAIVTGARTAVYEMPITSQVQAKFESGIKWDKRELLVTGDGMFAVDGPITSIVPDPTGRHFLVLADPALHYTRTFQASPAIGPLYRWSVGDEAPTQIAGSVTAASWAPWWGPGGDPSRG